MSAATVRAAIQAFLKTPPIPGMGVVYRAEPFYSPAVDRDPLTGGTPGAGAVAFVWFTNESESRITLPALTGSKEVTYDATLAVKYGFDRQADDTGTNLADAWVDPFDQLVDAVKDRIRSDPTFGAPGVIFEAAQSDNDLSVRYDAPVQNGMTVECWFAIDFKVTEIVTA